MKALTKKSRLVKAVNYIGLTALFVCTTLLAFAPPPPPPPGGGGVPVPVEGGMGILFLILAIYTIKLFYDEARKEKSATAKTA